MSETAKKRVVILGAGFAGMNCARGLAKADVSVTMIDRHNHHLFQPLLYQVATASLSPAQVASPIRAILKSQRNTEVLLGEVHAIDKTRRVVRFNEREISYDYLVIAVGAVVSYFGHPEWAKYALGLKTISDATEIRRRVLLAFENAESETDLAKRKRLLHFILVGGGPTGVEMAGAIAELAHGALLSDFRHINPAETKITLIEAAPRILGTFPESLSEEGRKTLEGLGVDVLTNTRVENIDSAGVWVNGQCLESNQIIWTAGVQAAPVAKWLGVEGDRGGRVKVGPDLSLPGHPEIFVAGDAALVLDEDGKPLPGVAPVAMQEGKYLARLLRKKLIGESTPPPFRYWDKGNLATIGRSNAIADLGKFQLKGWFGWVAWVVVHIYYLIGFKNRLTVMFEWAWAYLTFQRGVRLIVDKPECTASIS